MYLHVDILLVGSYLLGRYLLEGQLSGRQSIEWIFAEKTIIGLALTRVRIVLKQSSIRKTKIVSLKTSV